MHLAELDSRQNEDVRIVQRIRTVNPLAGSKTGFDRRNHHFACGGQHYLVIPRWSSFKYPCASVGIRQSSLLASAGVPFRPLAYRIPADRRGQAEVQLAVAPRGPFVGFGKDSE